MKRYPVNEFNLGKNVIYDLDEFRCDKCGECHELCFCGDHDDEEDE